MDKNSFILYTEYSKHIQLLTDEQSGILFKNIFSYVETGEVKDMDAVTEMAFSFIKANLDRDIKKYEEIVEKRRESGKLGGRPPKANKANGFSEKQTIAKKPDNDNENVNVNVNDKYKRKSNKFCDYPQADVDFDALERKVFKN